MLKAETAVEGLHLPKGYHLKIMSYANDNLLVVKLMEAALDTCAIIIADYELLSGISVNWKKVFCTLYY